MSDYFNKSEYKLILETMLHGMKYLCPVKRKRAEIISEKISVLAKGEQLIFDEITPLHKLALRKKYKTFDDVKASIMLHAKEHGKINLIPSDEPRQLLLGWECSDTGKKWLIRLADMKTWISSRPDNERAIFGKALMTHEGKKKLAAALSEPPTEELV